MEQRCDQAGHETLRPPSAVCAAATARCAGRGQALLSAAQSQTSWTRSALPAHTWTIKEQMVQDRLCKGIKLEVEKPAGSITPTTNW